ncbi:hypothetical protein [Staphylococcus massiliensis]|uniref:Uncharacterized protein n=1 Tax=Staphylococcus massiliensis S46 TaxID=1229783 RepID=K9AFG1_9STAP|nr:hypothetical protein [Staphylococcus massiliensis]EKU46013.1 hypothetical protein C273_10142 [Staphylococcus massiliensis S46]MCG3400281.1 hypothetical protein [Staphylococcus massiliensis]MCG3401911.1 hypothetical protein [Staphylococcus massiliensis]MCG3412427.1 hypothetical protein [Staphylococcus massiliensis]PNZ98000.1 hypothetical protein CD133_09620 [Staphylococcus massiliensis CCUG 55927]
MRPNDKVLLENVEDYLNHKEYAPNLIDDVKTQLKKDFKRSERHDVDYIDYRKQTVAEIIVNITRNLNVLQFSHIAYLIFNLILISYVYDKHLVLFGATNGLTLIYIFLIFPLSTMVYYRILIKNYLYRNRLEAQIGTALSVLAIVIIALSAFNINLGVFTVTPFFHQALFVLGLIMTLVSLYRIRLEYACIGLLLCQKTLDIFIHNQFLAQLASLIIWILLLVIIIYYTIQLSRRHR